MKKTKTRGKSNSRALILLVAVIIIAIGAVIIVQTRGGNGETNTDGDATAPKDTKVITGEKLTAKRDFDGLEISNVQFQLNGKTTLITADVKNATGADKEGQYVNVNVLDKKGKVLTSIGGFIDPIKAGDTIRFSSIILSNKEDGKAYDIEITKQEKRDTTTTSGEDGQE